MKSSLPTRTLAVLALSALASLPPALAHPGHALRTTRPAASSPLAGVLDLLRIGFAKLEALTRGTDPTSSTDDAGVRIDPEGSRLRNDSDPRPVLDGSN
jgi:hypothetical protein